MIDISSRHLLEINSDNHLAESKVDHRALFIGDIPDLFRSEIYVSVRSLEDTENLIQIKACTHRSRQLVEKVIFAIAEAASQRSPKYVFSRLPLVESVPLRNVHATAHRD